MKTIIFVGVAILAAPAFANAQSLGSDQPTAVPARFQDLDLTNRADANAILSRIGDAALEACGASSFSLPDYRAAVQRSDCYRHGVGEAVASLNAPALTDAYRHHGYVEVGSYGERSPTGE